MNKHIIKSLLAGAAAVLTFAGCEVYDFNENYLDDYEPGLNITDPQHIDYTLTENDYSTIANNETNKALAAAAGATDVLNAIKSNKYFSSSDDAAIYLPAFIANAYKTLDDNSTVLVTYTLAQEMPEEVAAMNAMTTYTLTKADYQTIWGSETDYVEAGTPATASKVASVLPKEEQAEGSYLAVTYNYAAMEPNFQGTEDPGTKPEDPATPELTSVLGVTEVDTNTEYTVVGVVTAVTTEEVVLTDKTGSIVIDFYQMTDKLLNLGDVVKVSGKINNRYNGWRFQASNVSTLEVVGTQAVYYPEAATLTAEHLVEVANRGEAEFAEFVKVSGTYTKADNGKGGYYHNIYLDGEATIYATFEKISDDNLAKFKEGPVSFYAYLYNNNKSKYVSVIYVAMDGEITPGETPSDYELSSVLAGTVDTSTEYTVTGVVTAVGTDVAVVTDKAGSVIIDFYQYSGSVALKSGDVVKVAGKFNNRYNGWRILASSASSLEVIGSQAVTYPAATDLTAAHLVEVATRTSADFAEFAKITGELKIENNYYNIYLDGDDTHYATFASISDADKAKFAAGPVSFYAYLYNNNTSKGYVSVIYVDMATKAAAYGLTRAASVASEPHYGVYAFNGSSFAEADNAVLQPADYKAMGQSGNTLTDTSLLPLYLAKNYPYAKAEDVKYVSYFSSANHISTLEYVFNGFRWVQNNYFITKSDQFRRKNKTWEPDPTLELNYLTDGSEEIKAFCQYCANWVYDNIDMKLGAPARDNVGEILSTNAITVNGARLEGNLFVSSYGNNEWYAGTYAYYGELNWRATNSSGNATDSYRNAIAAVKNLGLENEIDLGIDLDIDTDSSDFDAAVVQAMMHNCGTVFAGVIEAMYPDISPELYSKVVVNIYNYFSKKYNDDLETKRGVYSFTFEVVVPENEGDPKVKYIEDSLTFVK